MSLLRSRQPTVRRGLAVPLLLVVASCVNVDFKEPVSSFSQNLTTASATLLTYYTELNRFERDVYLTHALYDPSRAILATDAQGEKTPLLGFFSAESIKARADSLALLSIYAKRLAELAGTDAPQRFAAASEVLGKNLLSLGDTFASLSGSSAEKKDSTAASYIGPISTLVGIVGQMYLEAERDRALTAAIQQGAPEVNKILDLLEQDITAVIVPLRETGELQTVALMVRDYNTRRNSMSFAERQRSIDSIKAAIDRYQAAVAYAPTDLIQGVRDAHNALVQYASSPRTPGDLASLVAALEAFENRLRPIVQAVQGLRNR